jgi:hypothetical protein
MRTRGRAPPLPRPCIALSRAAPHRATRGRQERGTPATENKREVLMRRACARAPIPRSSLLLGNSVQPTPSPHCGLASCLLGRGLRVLRISAQGPAYLAGGIVGPSASTQPSSYVICRDSGAQSCVPAQCGSRAPGQRRNVPLSLSLSFLSSHRQGGFHSGQIPYLEVACSLRPPRPRASPGPSRHPCPRRSRHGNSLFSISSTDGFYIRSAHTQPALQTGLMAPAWRLLHVSWGVNPDS